MPVTLVITISCLILAAIIGRKVIKLPSNIWLLFVAQPLAMSSASMVVFAGGLVATKIAPSPELATLPLTVMIIGIALAVIPTSLLMKKYGRRLATMAGLSVGVLGALMLMAAALTANFAILIFGALLLGCSMAFVAQMRFAALESLTNPQDAPKAISVLMVGGIFAAVIGPEVAVYGKSMIESPHGFAGSFLGLAILIISAIAIISRLEPMAIATEQHDQRGRSVIALAKQPLFIIAVSAGAIAFAVMSFVMTATPLSMNVIEGHSLESTKWVIQSHISAMYLPSLLSVLLIRYLGIAKMMLIGCTLYGAVVLTALSGEQIHHYWWTMVLLGVGWNFLYSCGTLLLPDTYLAHERFKAQAVNDFTIFSVQAIGSLLAGIILFKQGWHSVIYAIIPAIVIISAVSIFYYRRHASAKGMQPIADQ